MSNKTSDKNVANIEEDVKILEEFAEICKAGLACYDQTREGKALEHILAEREQDKKRIKELEEENTQLEAIKDEAIKRYNFESIPVQKGKVKKEELGIAILECEYDDDDVEEYKNDVEKEKRILLIKKSALEELLEEK